MVDGLITGTINFALFAVLVAMRRALHHQDIRSFGIHADARGRRLIAGGLAAGFLLVAFYAAVSVSMGLGTLTVVPGAWPATLLVVACWGFGYAGVALFEEGLFRSYLLATLQRFVRPATAIAVQAVLFAALHVFGYASDRYWWIGLANVALLGIALALIVLRTRSLMAAVGFHLAWDLAQTTVFMRQSRHVETILNLRITFGIWTGTAATIELGLIVSLAAAALVSVAAVIPNRR